MGLGAKIGLVAGLLTAAVVALVVLPGSKDPANPADAYHDAGIQTALGVAAGLNAATAPIRAGGTPAASPAMQAIEQLAAGLEAEIKTASVSQESRGPIFDELGLLRDAAGGRSIRTRVDDMLAKIRAELVKAGNDREKADVLRERRERLSKIAVLLESGAGGAAPTASTANAPMPDAAPGYEVLATWWNDPTDKTTLAQSDRSSPLPKSSTAMMVRPNAGYYSATVRGVAATIYFADVGPQLRAGRVYVAMQDPPRPSSGGGSGIGIVMLILGPLLVGGIAAAIASGHGKPLKDLSRELDRLGSSGDPARRVAARGPEANAIARSVERMVANLKFRDQHEMGDLQEVVSKEQGVAAEIHHGLMPKDPPRIPGWEVETLFKPGFEIGGDHFDYFRIDDAHLGVILMDTSVRGIPAAITMSMARAYVRAEAPGVTSPAELLTKVNRLLASDLSQGQYVTALYAVIDTSNGTAKIASAGHLPLVVYRHAIGKTAIINPEGIALGLDVGPVFDRAVIEVEVDIGVGDRLVLHTDGALKVQNDAGEEYGEQRLYDAIKQKAPMNSQAFINFVGSAIDLFHATTPQNDDITISTVKRLK